MIVKLAHYEVRAEALPQALAALATFVDEVKRKEGGTAKYEAYQHKDPKTRFTHLMVFNTPSAEQYHGKTAWHKKYFDTIAPLCASPPVFELVEPVPAK